MTLEAIRTVTPYTTFFLAVVVGIIGWLLRWMIHGSGKQFSEMKEKVTQLGMEVKNLDKERQADQKYLYEKFVNKAFKNMDFMFDPNFKA